jgi:hypothetical protein
MSILDRLRAVPGTYWGDGDGPHSGPFVARITVTASHAGPVALDYEAWSPTAGLQHAERALLHRSDNGHVVLDSTLEGAPEALSFQEGQPGVFGSLNGQQVGVVITVREGTLSWAWWWTGEDNQLREQSRAVVRRLLEPAADVEEPAPVAQAAALPEPAPVAEPVAVPIEAVPIEAVPIEAVAAEVVPAEPARPKPVLAPWPGVLVLTGMGGVAALARDLAKAVPGAAVVRGDLLARAVSGTGIQDGVSTTDQDLWHGRLAARLTREYAELGLAVVLAELESTGAGTQALLEELDAADVGPVRLLVVDETTTAEDVLAELPRPGRRRS